MCENFPTLDEQEKAKAARDAALPKAPRVNWLRQLWQNLSITLKFSKKNPAQIDGAEIKDKCDF